MTIAHFIATATIFGIAMLGALYSTINYIVGGF